MSNLMASFGIGVSGLNVNQTSLNTTAHNLANVDTEGYVRQQPLQVDFMYNNLAWTPINIMQTGLGSNMETIRQVRDVFLDKAYRLEVGREGFYNAQYEAETEIEDLFGEMNGVSFKESLGNFWENLQELVKEPDSIVKRANLIETGVSFIERAENISNQIKAYQVNLNVEIKDTVQTINDYGDRIKELNKFIVREESRQQAANDFRDERNLLLDKLGQLAKITYKETPDGTVTVNLEGVQFVTESEVYHLGTEQISEGSEMLKVVWEGYGGFDVYPSYSVWEEVKQLDADESDEPEMEKVNYVYLNSSTADNTDVGYLKGLVIARGNYQAKYTDIPIYPDEKDYTDEDGIIDTENYEIALADFANKVEDYNKTIDGSVVMTVQAQFDQLIHSVVTTINDILCPNADVGTYMKHIGIEDADADSASITYTDANGEEHSLSGEELNGILIWDEGIAPLGMDEAMTGGEALFNRKGMDRYCEGVITLPDGTEKKVLVYNRENKDDNYSLFTLGEIEVNPKVLQDYSKLPLNGNEYQGLVGAYDVATCNKLLEAWDGVKILLDPNTLTTSVFKDYYNSFIGALAVRGEEAYNISKNQEAMVDQINTSRQNVIGVSSDDELTNLIKYQHAYNANARYVNVISEMLEHIIERLGH